MDAADLNRVIFRRGAAARPFDGLLARAHVDHPIAAQHFLDLREGAIDDGRLPALEADPSAGSRRM
jgi:hypothetical protein